MLALSLSWDVVLAGSGVLIVGIIIRLAARSRRGNGRNPGG
jgi:hypothetical protein